MAWIEDIRPKRQPWPTHGPRAWLLYAEIPHPSTGFHPLWELPPDAVVIDAQIAIAVAPSGAITLTLGPSDNVADSAADSAIVTGSGLALGILRMTDATQVGLQGKTLGIESNATVATPGTIRVFVWVTRPTTGLN